MARHYPYWDISWLVATIFTLGSAVWVINAFFAYLPLAQPSTLFGNEVLVGGGVSAFIGATIFEIGSVLLMIEAVNENKAGCFGWALERAFSDDRGGKGKIRIRPDEDNCVHHHTNRGNFIGKCSGMVGEKSSPTLHAHIQKSRHPLARLFQTFKPYRMATWRSLWTQTVAADHGFGFHQGMT